MTNVQPIANYFDKIETYTPEIQASIERLSREPFLDLDRVKLCHRWMYEVLISRMTGLLVGDSRSGKTVASKAFAAECNKLRLAKEKRIKPVVYIQVPKGCGARDFFIKILKALGHRATSGTITDLRERTLDTLEVFQVEMLIIDEANHLKFETFAEVRHIYDHDDLKIAVLLVGTTSRLKAIVKRDEQVENRFLECYELDKLEDAEFKEIVRIWVLDVLDMPDALNLAEGEPLKILKKVTNKLIGRLDMILRKAAIRSLLRGYKNVDVDVLKEIAKSVR